MHIHLNIFIYILNDISSNKTRIGQTFKKAVFQAIGIISSWYMYIENIYYQTLPDRSY
jgi:hypothetical protein